MPCGVEPITRVGAMFAATAEPTDRSVLWGGRPAAAFGPAGCASLPASASCLIRAKVGSAASKTTPGREWLEPNTPTFMNIELLLRATLLGMFLLQ